MELRTICLVFTSIKLQKKLIIVLFFILLTSTVGAKEYIIKPAPNDQAGASIHGEKVIELEDTIMPYWQFLLWLAAMQLISATDMLFYPTRIIFIIAGFKVKDHVNLLENPSRNSIYTYIKSKPGAYFSDVVKNTGLNRGTVRYHMQILKTQNKIEAYEDKGKMRYFQNNSMYSENEKKVLVIFQNITNKRIISGILNGRCTNLTLAQEIGVSKSTVSMYVKNLKEIGFINETKRGRSIIYKINASYKALIEKHKK